MTTLAEIEENFALFDDWDGRYDYLIELGRSLPPFPEAERTDANLVRGCQSRVWLVCRLENGRLRLAIDSDALIVRGLAAIVLATYDGKTPQEALALDTLALFERLGLLAHLSPTRGNGLRAMIERIRECARAAIADANR